MKTNVFINDDCLNYMKTLEDKSIDLVLTDPPYGINASEMTMGTGKNKQYSKGKKWDIETPSMELFNEIFRISKNQIIWGGNYFADKLTISRGWIFWDKLLNKDISFADGELAWTSFDAVIKKANIQYSGFLGMDINRFHPTQKPVKLFEWCLKNYSNENDIILDCFSGSGTTAIACHNLNRQFICIEKDKEYFDKSVIRYNKHIQQIKMFT